jgi:nicotinamidase/pyrazinamidase
MDSKESAVKESGRVLVLVDVQNDFHPGGSLAVPNADQDCKRISSLILRSLQPGHYSIDRIICTMDSHNTCESNR